MDAVHIGKIPVDANTSRVHQWNIFEVTQSRGIGNILEMDPNRKVKIFKGRALLG